MIMNGAICANIDKDLVKPTTPHFAAEYGARFGKPNRPAAEDKLTMDALFDFLRCSTTRRAQLN